MKRPTVQPKILDFLKKQKIITVPNDNAEQNDSLDHMVQIVPSLTLSEALDRFFDPAPSSISSVTPSALPTTLGSTTPPVSPSTLSFTPPSPSYDPNDIGHFIFQVGNMDDTTKYNIIKSSWKPPPTFKFPFSVHKKRDTEEKQKRFVNQNHFNCHEWLVYSDIKKGLFCKYCVTFSDFCGKNKAKVEKFVTKPLTSFAKLTGKDGDLKKHENTLYHQNNVAAANNFCKIFLDPSKSIVNLILTDRLKLIEENTQRLKPIIKTIIFLGRQNIAFRGRRDDGRINLDDEQESIQNEGNFRELLRFRVEAGDTILKEHLRSARSNATYISKTTQNDLIETIGELIRDDILARVRKSQYYSVMFDETTDVSSVSQLSLVLTYVHKNKRYEDFVDFIDVHEHIFPNREAGQEPKISGNFLGQLVLQKLKKFGLNVFDCVDVATDGCSIMISEKKGAVKKFNRKQQVQLIVHVIITH